MDETHRHAFPLLAAAQAQGHLIHNEALVAIDALLHPVIAAFGVNEPPEGVSPPHAVTVGGAPTGLFEGQAGRIASLTDAGWRFYDAPDGMLAYSVPDGTFMRFALAGGWEVLTAEFSGETLDRLGISTSPDATNRLSVKSPAVLLAAPGGAEGDDCRLVINRDDPAATASMIFQSDYQGRAEAGLAGDDRFRIKVADSGGTWREALSIDPDTARVSLPNTDQPSQMLFNLLEDAGRFGGTPEPLDVLLSAYTQPSYVAAYNGSTFTQGEKYYHNSTTYGGSAAALSANIQALVEKVRDVPRFGPEFYTLKVTAGSGTLASITEGGTSYALAIHHRKPAFWPKSMFCFNVKVTSGSALIAAGSAVPDSQTYVDGALAGGNVAIDAGTEWKQVVRRYDYDRRSFYYYAPALFAIYATPGTVFHIAMPFLFPGHVPVPEDYFVFVPSLTNWR